MSTMKKLQLEQSEITALPSLPPIEPPSPLVFPTFQQLVEADRESQQTTRAAAPRKLNDLFDGMLGTLDPLLADFQASPERYGEETHELLGQMIHGSKSLEQLSESERRLLNLATFDFFQAPKTKPLVPKPILKEAAVKEGSEDEEETEDDSDDDELQASKDKGRGPIPGVDVPVTELPAYWWLS